MWSLASIRFNEATWSQNGGGVKVEGFDVFARVNFGWQKIIAFFLIAENLEYRFSSAAKIERGRKWLAEHERDREEERVDRRLQHLER